jgi:hypothetical protein
LLHNSAQSARQPGGVLVIRRSAAIAADSDQSVAVISAIPTGRVSTRLGRELRALSDNMALTEVSGIDTVKPVRITWTVAVAGLAGILYAAAIGSINPNFGNTTRAPHEKLLSSKACVSCQVE